MVTPNSILHLKLHQPIEEHVPINPFEDMKIPLDVPFIENVSKLGMSNILTAIEKAKNNENIDGIYLDIGSNFQAGFGVIEEIRQALHDFQNSGKHLVAYASTYTLSSYYLASCADHVFLAHQGFFHFAGLSVETMFYSELLDKYGIEMQIARAGKFKSAVEPYTRKSFSEENKAQTLAWMNEIWANLKNTIAASRNLDPASIEQSASSFMLFESPEHIMQTGLIDSFMYPNQIDDFLKTLSKHPDKKLKLVSLNSMLKTKITSPANQDQVAILFAQGVIGTQEAINCQDLCKTIQKLENDDKVKAVVLRVNSPGGAVYDSEIIWQALSKLKEKKPLVISMSDLAASGGYYISSAADIIVAHPNTITGSIGVFAMFPKVEGLAKNLSLSVDHISTHPYGNTPSIFRGLNSQERDIFQASIDRTYDLFLQRCADGREVDKSYIHKHAQGRVWSGTQAKEIGLVDELGGLRTAVEIAAKEGNISDYDIKHFPKHKSFIENFLQEGFQTTQMNILQETLGEHAVYLEPLKTIKNMQGAQARMPYFLHLH